MAWETEARLAASASRTRGGAAAATWVPRGLGPMGGRSRGRGVAMQQQRGIGQEADAARVCRRRTSGMAGTRVRWQHHQQTTNQVPSASN